MDVLFEKEYNGSIFTIKENKDPIIGFDLFLFIDNELISILDSDEVIEYRIYHCIPYYIKELYSHETIHEFCEDVNDFVRQWQW